MQLLTPAFLAAAANAFSFNMMDANGNGIPDIFEDVIAMLREPEEDCSCLQTHGLPVQFTEDGEGFIEYTDEEGETHQLPANYGLTTC